MTKDNWFIGVGVLAFALVFCAITYKEFRHISTKPAQCSESFHVLQAGTTFKCDAEYKDNWHAKNIDGQLLLICICPGTELTDTVSVEPIPNKDFDL